MATIYEFVLKNIGLWWRYGISRHCDEWKYFIIGRIFESEIILIPPSLKISESSSNGSYRNTDEVWWRYGISRSCDEWLIQCIKKCQDFLGRVILGATFFRAKSSLIQSSCRSFIRVIVLYEISKVNFRIEAKILVRMSEEI
jgi:hypothetical protein